VECLLSTFMYQSSLQPPESASRGC
jgi:hypothetical protein